MRPSEFPEAEFSAMDSDADPQLCAGEAELRAERLAPGVPAPMDVLCCEHRLPRVIALSDREVENGHDGIPDRLVEQPVMFPDGARAFVIEGVQQSRDGFRRLGLREAGVTSEKIGRASCRERV